MICIAEGVKCCGDRQHHMIESFAENPLYSNLLDTFLLNAVQFNDMPSVDWAMRHGANILKYDPIDENALIKAVFNSTARLFDRTVSLIPAKNRDAALRDKDDILFKKSTESVVPFLLSHLSSHDVRMDVAGKLGVRTPDAVVKEADKFVLKPCC